MDDMTRNMVSAEMMSDRDVVINEEKNPLDARRMEPVAALWRHLW